MISGINESKTLPKYISCNCRCESDSRKYDVIKSEIMINVNVSVKSQWNIVYVKTIVFGILVQDFEVDKVMLTWKVLLLIQ